MIAIHQSQFLPWLPYFYKMFKSDVFIILDDVQYQKNGVQNRNMIKTSQGASWLTVPVCRNLDTLIKEVEITDQRELKKILKTIEMNYRRSPFFKTVYASFSDVMGKKYASLHELNMALLSQILSLLGKNINIQMSSQLGTTMKKGDLVLEIVQKLKEKDYLSGQGGLEYMNKLDFKDAGINIYLSEFHYTQYPQQWNRDTGFIEGLSIIDLLFNDLENASSYIMRNGTVRKDVI